MTRISISGIHNNSKYPFWNFKKYYSCRQDYPRKLCHTI